MPGPGPGQPGRRGAGAARGAGGAGAGAGGRRGRATDDDEKTSQRDLFDDGNDWVDDEGATSPVLDEDSPEGSTEGSGQVSTTVTGRLLSAGRPSSDGVRPRATISAPSAATMAPLSVHRPGPRHPHPDADLGRAFFRQLTQP